MPRLRSIIDQSPTASCIIVFWHQSIFGVVGLHRHLGDLTTLTSPSRDGQLLTDLLEAEGIDVLRGTATKRKSAVRVLVGLTRAARRGRNVVFAPDGPTGPFKVMKPGAIEVARASGAPIVPVGVRGTVELRARMAWDRFRLPLPRAHMALVIGRPIWIPKQESREHLARRLRHVSIAMHEAEAVASRAVRAADPYPPVSRLSPMRRGQREDAA